MPMQNPVPQGQYQIQQPPKKPFYKKPWFIILAVIIVIGIIAAAAGGGGSDSSGKDSGKSDNTGTSEQNENAQPAEKAEIDTDYPITIDSANVGTDSLGKKVIIVTYTWTNNSDKAVSFEVALDAKAYQNGIELPVDVFMDDAESYDFRDVKPGTTSTINVAYELADTSEVEVEVKELFSLNDDVIASQKFAVQ